MKNFTNRGLIIFLTMVFIDVIMIKRVYGMVNITCTYANGMQSFSTSNVLNKETLEREFNLDGLKYKYHIENTKSFTNVDDYITIENSKGHKITYPLECE